MHDLSTGRNPAPHRRGLTLMELVVVMLILAAIAGILLPMLPNMITRAHTSTSATNLGEIAKAIQTHESLYLAYPNNLDSLVTDSAGTLASYLPNASGDVTTLVATADHAATLHDAGIKTMAQMAPATVGGDWSPTFFPYGPDAGVIPTSTAIGPATVLASITGTAAAREFSAPINAEYVVFGLGSRSSMQGKTLMEPPVHFSESATEAPSAAYARYGIVFQLTGGATGTEALDKARFIGICAFHAGGIEGLNDHLAEYWKTKTE